MGLGLNNHTKGDTMTKAIIFAIAAATVIENLAHAAVSFLVFFQELCDSIVMPSV